MEGKKQACAGCGYSGENMKVAMEHSPFVGNHKFVVCPKCLATTDFEFAGTYCNAPLVAILEMSPLDAQAALIRGAYAIIHGYEQQIQTSDRPEEKLRARRLIQDQWRLINTDYAPKYRKMLVEADIAMPTDISQILV